MAQKMYRRASVSKDNLLCLEARGLRLERRAFDLWCSEFSQLGFAEDERQLVSRTA